MSENKPLNALQKLSYLAKLKRLIDEQKAAVKASLNNPQANTKQTDEEVLAQKQAEFNLLQAAAELNLKNRQRMLDVNTVELEQAEVKAGNRESISSWAQLQAAALYLFGDICNYSPHISLMLMGDLRPELEAAADKLGINTSFSYKSPSGKKVTIKNSIQGIIERSINKYGEVTKGSDLEKVAKLALEVIDPELFKLALNNSIVAHEDFVALTCCDDELKFNERNRARHDRLNELRSKIERKLTDALALANIDSSLLPLNNLWYRLDQWPTGEELALEVTTHDTSKKNLAKGIIGKALISMQIDYDQLEKDEKITISTALTPYEKAVLNGILSIHHTCKAAQQPTVFTPELIYKAMTGREAKVESTIKEITAIVEKLRKIDIKINASNEFNSDLIQELSDHCISCYACDFTHKSNGKKVRGWRLKNDDVLHGDPVLYKYTMQNGQYTTIPLKAFDIKDSNGKPLRLQGDRFAVINYLLREINRIERGQDTFTTAKIKFENKQEYRKKKGLTPLKEKQVKNKQSSKILFESMLNKVMYNCADDTDNKMKPIRLTEFAMQTLLYWQNIGRISDFKPIKKGKKIIGVEITPAD